VTTYLFAPRLLCLISNFQNWSTTNFFVNSPTIFLWLLPILYYIWGKPHNNFRNARQFCTGIREPLNFACWRSEVWMSVLYLLWNIWCLWRSFQMRMTYRKIGFLLIAILPIMIHGKKIFKKSRNLFGTVLRNSKMMITEIIHLLFDYPGET
jgi:hypothetical protein